MGEMRWAITTFRAPGCSLPELTRLFLARAENGKVAVDSAADTAILEMRWAIHDLPGAGVLIKLEKGLFLRNYGAAIRSNCRVPDRENLHRSPIDPKPDSTFKLNVTHSARLLRTNQPKIGDATGNGRLGADTSTLDRLLHLAAGSCLRR